MGLTGSQMKFLEEPIVLPSQRIPTIRSPGIFEKISASLSWLDSTDSAEPENLDEDKTGGSPPAKKEKHLVGKIHIASEQMNSLNEAVRLLNDVTARESIRREELERGVDALNAAVSSLSSDMEAFHKRYGSITPSSVLTHIGTSLQNAPAVAGTLHRWTRATAGWSTVVTGLSMLLMFFSMFVGLDGFGKFCLIITALSGSIGTLTWMAVPMLGVLLKRSKETA